MAAARRPPASFYPASELYKHVVMAGCALFCCRCGQEGRAPLPRDPGYGAAVEAFLMQHKHCEVSR